VNAEFQWWLLILGIVIGGALVYLVLADLQGDRDEDLAGADELPLDELDELGEDAERGPASVGDDAGVQRDGAQGETPVADLP
jgi:hypothetical protein